MMKYLCALFVSLLLPFQVEALVVESGRFSTLLSHVDENTLVLCDCDNTLVTCKTQMGSAQWRGYIRQKALRAGFQDEAVKEVVDRFWMFSQPFISVELVDKQTCEIVQELQSKTTVLVLTKRDPSEEEHTMQQLASVGLNFVHAELSDCIIEPLPHLASFSNGVIFCGSNEKGETLTAFLHQKGLNPKKIVFIDDREAQVLELAPAVEGENREYVGIRFNGCDGRVNNFNSRIAEWQWSALPEIISDDNAARAIFLTNP